MTVFYGVTTIQLYDAVSCLSLLNIAQIKNHSRSKSPPSKSRQLQQDPPHQRLLRLFPSFAFVYSQNNVVI